MNTQRSSKPSFSSTGFAAFALAALTFLVYLPVRHHGFVLFDDADYVSDNPMVQAGLSRAGIRWAFSTTYAANWHPLTWLSHMLDAQLFGPGPMGPHLMNVVLHAANAALLFVLLLELTRAFWRSIVVAALFALHPLHVESVAWLAERKDVLSALYFLLALLAYVRYAKETEVRNQRANFVRTFYFATLALFACALMSKPMAVTMPFVLLLLDYWPLGRIKARVAAGGSGSEDGLAVMGHLQREKVPFFLLSAAASSVTIIAQHQRGAVRSIQSFSVGERLENSLVACARYLGRTFWPSDLAIFYPHSGHWSAAAVTFSAILIGGISFIAVRFACQLPFTLTGWLWFLGMLVPTLGWIQVGNQSMADRYTYLPSIGLFIALVWGAELGARVLGRTFPIRLNPTAVLAVLESVAMIACIICTEKQLSYWRDAETVSRRAIAVTKDNFVAHNHLGSALLESGRVDEAIVEFEETLRLQPRFVDARCNLGNALLRQGRANEAVAQYRQVLEAQPAHLLARCNLGLVLLQQGNASNAIAQFQQALELHPDAVLAHFNLGNALLSQNRLEEAIAHYREVLKIQPGNADAHNNLGSALLRKGDSAEASAHFEQALQIQPRHANAHNNLGDLCLQEDKLDAAVAHYQKVLEVEPDDADARKNLGVALARQRLSAAATAQARP
jgi:tetratricopeptide (TPR) repeat protein